MTYSPKFLHQTGDGIYFLDHRLNPAVRAMFAAMSSRMPLGGIEARYNQIVEAVARDLQEQDWISDAQVRKPDEEHITEAKATWDRNPEPHLLRRNWQQRAEDRLCEATVHPKVQEFFNQFVLMYGHSSVMELTGSPPVYTEGISWYTAYLLFDDPLNIGQEFSTRAVRHKNWPMARECFVKVKGMYGAGEPEFVGKISPRVDIPIGGPLPEGFADIEMKEVEFNVPHPVLKELHDEWFEVFEAEVEAWRVEFSKPCGECHGDRKARNNGGIDGTDFGPSEKTCLTCNGTGKKYPNHDKEPFRPALDRARCVIPGTISTGCCHTGNLRSRSRILRDGLLLAQRGRSTAAIKVWEDIREGYRQAMPAMADMGLREAVYGDATAIPSHLLVRDAPECPIDVVVGLHLTRNYIPALPDRPLGSRTYLDAVWNQVARVDIQFDCSLAVARDWHRQRTMYPWTLSIVRGADGLIQLHHMYELKSEIGKANLRELLRKSTEAYDAFMAEGNQMQAMLCLPLGTKVRMEGQAGLRDAVYCLELRAYAHGANFEYKDQAERALEQLADLLVRAEILGPDGERVDLLKAVGFAV